MQWSRQPQQTQCTVESTFTHRNKYENLKAAFQYLATEHVTNLRSGRRNSYICSERIGKSSSYNEGACQRQIPHLDIKQLTENSGCG